MAGIHQPPRMEGWSPVDGGLPRRKAVDVPIRLITVWKVDVAFVAVQLHCGVVCVYTRLVQWKSRSPRASASRFVRHQPQNESPPGLHADSSIFAAAAAVAAMASLLITLPSAAHALLLPPQPSSPVNEIIFARRRRRQRRIFSPCWLGLFAMTAASPYGRQLPMKSGRKLTQLSIRSQGWIKAKTLNIS